MGTGMILILAVPFDNWIPSKVRVDSRVRDCGIYA